MLLLKQPGLSSEESDRRVRESVEAMLEDIEKRGEPAIRELAKEFDGWEDDFVLSDEKKQGLIDSVPQQVKDDIRFA
jgi:sulfopropanediol 3-dehydrogenase